MNIIEKSYSGTGIIPIETELESRRFVFLEGEITQKTADEFTKQILHLSLESSDPINILINSEGGDLDAGLKICDTVSDCPCTVNAYCFGRAYSMAAVIFESVNGKRNIVGHSKLMLHQPSITGMPRQTAGEIEQLSRLMSEKNDLLLSIVSKRSGIDIKRLKAETANDRYYDAEESVRYGLADAAVAFSEIIGIQHVKGE